MNITTKYNIGDTVWVIFQNQAQKVGVVSIRPHVTAYPETTYIQYGVNVGDLYYKEDRVFPSKEELIQSL